MNKEFLKGLVKETLYNINILLNDDHSLDTEIKDTQFMVNKATIMYEHLKLGICKKFNSVSDEIALVLILDEIIPAALLLANRYDLLTDTDKRELCYLYKETTQVYHSTFEGSD
jgi:hypothetical protein